MSLLYERNDHIAVLTINRPKVKNALDIDTLKEMEEAWYDFSGNDDLWVAILTGAGDEAFSAGADILL